MCDTGLLAKYRYPRTGEPYATKGAYKVLNQRFQEAQAAAAAVAEQQAWLEQDSGALRKHGPDKYDPLNGQREAQLSVGLCRIPYQWRYIHNLGGAEDKT